MDNNTNNNQNNKKKVARILIIILAIILIITGVIMIAQKYIDTSRAENEQERLSTLAGIETTVSEKDKVANPIDFNRIQSKNDEIYAWIKVPGTKVDYPILQSGVSDDFYLRHKAEDKSYSSSGAIYTQSMNTKTFEDRVTLIYGHNGYGDTMFTTLHKFENTEFFNKHTEFYIYTPDRKLTYKIVSAFKYDDRHIMNSFDFQDNDIFYQFLVMIQNPSSANKNVSNSLDKSLTIDDNIVVLSTCFSNQKGNRYLVCGVLTKNEKTN